MNKATIDRLTPEGKRFLSEIDELKKMHVKIGFQRGDVQEEDDSGNAVDLCDIALYNELGTSNAPSRPFMRDAIDKHKDEIDKFLDAQFGLLANGKTDAETMMQSIGVFLKGIVQREMVEGDFVPNAPSTIRRKHSDKPLIDTGRMRQSVNFVITKKEDND